MAKQVLGYVQGRQNRGEMSLCSEQNVFHSLARGFKLSLLDALATII